jgi:DeoR family suf operon transcriptional repressor
MAARQALAPGRRAILDSLKLRGEATAEEIAGELGVTASAVRQHLRALQDEGLVAHRDERNGLEGSPGPGRPRRRYCLTPAAESLWPKRYAQLTNQVLGILEESDPALIETVFERRRQTRVDRARRRLDGKTFDGRVKELASILDDDGYLADYERIEPGRWRVVEHNCAILDVAHRYGNACSTELAFLREAMPDAEITRVAHLLSGAHVCAYEILPRPVTPVPRS